MAVSSYIIGEMVGQGSFGRVYKARNRFSNNLVAYKVICKTGRCTSEVQALRNECEIQRNLHHPNIIRMLDSFETNDALVVITEFALKDLCQVLKEEGVLSENRGRKITRDLVSALHYLHSNKILHRDLKPPNVLLDSFDSAKLCDFGFARLIGNDASLLKSIKGTPLYMAPELMNESTYDYAADLWSLGCITYQLVTGRPPFTASSIVHLMKMIRLEPIRWPNYLTNSCLCFLKGLLQKNPNNRLTWPSLQYHPFINSESTSVHSKYLKIMNSVISPLNSDTSRTRTSLSSNANEFSNNHHSEIEVTEVPPVSSSEKISLINKLNVLSQKKCLNSSKEIDFCHESCHNYPEDVEFIVQKEEWLEFLRQTIKSLILNGDVDVLVEKHSLKLIMNAFNTYSTCPVVVTMVGRLLSLPFVAESVSENNVILIKQAYVQCEIMKDLLTVVKYVVNEIVHDIEIHTCHEVALQQLLLLIRYLIFTDPTLLKQLFHACISLNLFSRIKKFLIIRTKTDPFSVVKYVVAIFLRLYITIPESRQYIFSTFDDWILEFHSVMHESKDMNVHVTLCTFIIILSCTQPNFSKKNLEVIRMLTEDLTKSKIRSNVLVSQINGILEILRNMERKMRIFIENN